LVDSKTRCLKEAEKPACGSYGAARAAPRTFLTNPTLDLMTKAVRRELIGRESELEELAALRRSAADGHGRIVLIGGEAGIGKSELLRHFGARVASGRTMLATSRCVEFIQTPLAPLRDLLQHLERRTHAPADLVTRALVERLAFERDAEVNPGWLPEASLFSAIDGAFARYARHGAVVLTIEDVHWADRSTLAFLTYFADRLEKRRVLVVATYRADELGSQHPHLSEFSALLSRRAVSTISLLPLDARAIRGLVEEMADGSRALSTVTVAEIVKRSQGNPFFAEELMKSALDTGGTDAAAELPLSIRAAVLARAARLSGDARDVISFAAVLGERFAVDQLVALLGGDRGIVLRALEQARALRLLSDDASSPGEVAFRHALTQAVLYKELLAERVRPLHETIATELETRPNRKALSIELAHHWRGAGELQRAATYDEMAGDNAFAIGAFADALLYYGRALAVRENAAELEHKLGVALGSLNDLEAAIERLRRAGDLYRRNGDHEGFAENASALVAQLYNSGNAAAATTLCHEAIETLSAKLPLEKLDLFRARLAFHCIAALDDKSASTFLDEIREPILDPRLAMHASWNRFRVAAMRGDVEAWRRFSARALDAAAQIGDGGSWVRHLHCQIALDAVGLGNVQAAREHFRAATPPKREPQSLQTTMRSAALAFEHTLRGDFATAAELLREVGNQPLQSYPILVHVKSANFVLGICSGDDARLRHEDTDSFLRYGIEHGMKVAIGLLGGPYAWALGILDERDAAAAWIERIGRALHNPHRFLFAYLAGAQFGRPEDVLAMRQQLVDAAALPADRVNKAALGLFDAFAAQRGIIATDGRAAALGAAEGFDAIGWPWLAARAYELGGESRRSLETYRSLGSVRDLRRLEVERSEATTSTLSSRELEVAELVAKGHSNDEISQILHISARTAEKHVSSALRKLNLRSRLQLGQLLARSQAGEP
jgi:DNA-binding CsgD family transcriptional regulator